MPEPSKNRPRTTRTTAASKARPAHSVGVLSDLLGNQGERLIEGLRLVEPSRIKTRPQARTHFDEAALGDLRESIAELRRHEAGVAGTGILQPLTVRPDAAAGAGEAGYILIAGERRLRAARDLELERVPVLVEDVSESLALVQQMIENLQRQDLPPLDEARGLQQLMSEQKLSLREAARLIGKDKGYLEARLNLLKYGPDVQAMVSARADSLRHARFINTIEDAALREQLIRAVLEDGIGEREVKKRVETHFARAADTSDAPDLGQVSARADTSAPQAQALGAQNGRIDPLAQAVQPAAAFLSNAVNQLDGLHLSAAYRRQMRQALAAIKDQIAAIEAKIG